MIWTVESEYDKDAVGQLAQKLLTYLERPDVTIQTAGAKAYNSLAKRLRRKPNALKIAVEAYLKRADKLIFVIDSDSQASLVQRRKEKYSMINQIERVIASKQFDGRVYLAMAVQELEAWLLIDCLGICCYFARDRYKKQCRNSIKRNRKLNNLVRKYQKGDTELIVESQSGGQGPKEYLTLFSKDILKAVNPNKRDKHIDREKYREALSPSIVEYIEISRQTLRRNPSLKRFCQLLE